MLTVDEDKDEDDDQRVTTVINELSRDRTYFFSVSIYLSTVYMWILWWVEYLHGKDRLNFENILNIFIYNNYNNYVCFNSNSSILFMHTFRWLLELVLGLDQLQI